MLGRAEWRLVEEALGEYAPHKVDAERKSPYLTPHFALSMAVTKAVAAQCHPLSVEKDNEEA